MKMASNHRMTKRTEKYLRSTDKSWWIMSLGMIQELDFDDEVNCFDDEVKMILIII
jgi:hypothetical protein